MGKSKRSDKEYTREQRLVKENKQLKHQVMQLRKQLARVDLDRYSSVKEMIEEHYQQDEAQEGQNILEKLKKEWSCHQCYGGYLEIILYNKLENTYYFRKCSNCPNRTKSQKYNSNVRGIIKEAALPKR